MYRGHFKLDNNSPPHNELVQWVLGLPRFIWELGSEDLPATEVINFHPCLDFSQLMNIASEHAVVPSSHVSEAALFAKLAGKLS